MAFGWSGHDGDSFNCDRVGLEAIHGRNMAHGGGFGNKEFLLVDIQLKSLKHGDKDAVVVDWTSLAPQPGIKMPSVILGGHQAPYKFGAAILRMQRIC